MDRKETVLRNTDEVITESELEELLEEPQRSEEPRAYVGYEPSGPVHVGHWLSIRKLRDVEDAGFQPVVLWADEHALMNRKADHRATREGKREWISSMADYWQATFEALGLEDAEFVRGSEFQYDPDYVEDFRDVSSRVTGRRAEHALGDVGNDERTSVAQIQYPIMQALDIAHLDIDLAIGGTDQRKIHVFAREELPALGYEKPTSLHYPLLTSLKGAGEKMSSSEPATMFPLHASEEVIHDRIDGAYCNVDEGFDVNPVEQMAKYLVFGADESLEIERPAKYGGDVAYASYEELERDFRSGDLHPQDLKNGVADHLVERLAPVRTRLASEPELLEPLQTDATP